MGFTLKRALELVRRPATVEVAELIPELVEWNRTFLVEHNGPLLDDERTKIYNEPSPTRGR
jgi:spermidine synthase